MSSQSISLKTSDGHSLAAYEARPDKPRGGIVLLQEIFGITGYIRRVCEGYAGHGYHVVAPALFDRIRPGIELTYSKEDAVTGRELRSKIPWEQTFADLEAAKARLKSVGKVATLGYCWGGTISWRAAGHVEGNRGRGLLLRHANRSLHGGAATLPGADAFRRQRSHRNARACRRVARGAGRTGRNSGLSGRPQLQLQRNSKLSRGERGTGAATLARISGRPCRVRSRRCHDLCPTA